MFFAQWAFEDLYWWGEQLWIFMKTSPPQDWIVFPLYYIKLAIYGLSIILIISLPIYWLVRRSRRNHRQLLKYIKVVRHTFVCPHCGHAPNYPPVSGTYYCERCGKPSKTKIRIPTIFSFN